MVEITNIVRLQEKNDLQSSWLKRSRSTCPENTQRSDALAHAWEIVRLCLDSRPKAVILIWPGHFLETTSEDFSSLMKWTVKVKDYSISAQWFRRKKRPKRSVGPEDPRQN
jgi:hypothetical protein